MRVSFGILFIWLCLFWACKQRNRPDNIQDTQSIIVDTALLIKQADSLFAMGELYDSLNKKDSALYFHEQALAFREQTRIEDLPLLKSYQKVADYYQHGFKYDVADKFFDNAMVLANNIEMSPLDLVNLYAEVANCKANLKDFPTSISLVQRTLHVLDEKLPQQTRLYHRLYLTLASNYYYLQDYNKGVEYLNKSLNYLQQDDHLRLSIVYNALGMFHRDKGESKIALNYFNIAVAHSLKLEANSNELAKIYLQKSFAHRDIGELDSTEHYLKLNLAIRKEVFGEKDVNTFGAKYSIGTFYEDINKYDSAIKYYHESLISVVQNFNNHDIQSNPVPNQTELNRDLIIGLSRKATALKKFCEADSAKCVNRHLALNTFLLADSVFSVFIKSLAHDDPRMRQMEEEKMPYDDMLELAFACYEQSGNKAYLEKSFLIIERSRAQLVELALNQAEAYSNAGISDEIRIEERNLIRQRSEVLRQLSTEGISAHKIDSLGEVLLTLGTQFTRFQRKLEELNPGYFAYKYNQNITDIRELQSLLGRSKSIMLEYLWGKEKIYVLTLNKDTLIIRAIHQTESFKTAFKEFVMELSGDPGETYRQENFQRFSQAAFALYQELVEGLVPPGLRSTTGDNLIISADGPLATFPFEALITSMPMGNEVDYRLSYLLNRFPISYTYSAGILIRQTKQERTGSKLLALGYAGSGPSRTQRNGHANLPGTEKEIQSIKEIMKNSYNRYLLENDASESTFKSQVSEFNIVHLALHGVADSVKALESRLIFRTEADTIDDGSLYAHELYNLDLSNLNLAVLSACESGIGKPQAGEGLMSIARGFAYSGCPSLIISLWKIDDRTSAKVMGNFYKHLADGDNINEALRKAKAGYIESARELNSHPAYWAAFLQVGDSRAIDSRDYNWWLLIIVAVGMFFLFVFTWKVMRKQITANLV